MKASDFDLLLDYNFWVISIGLGLVYATAVDFSWIFPGFLNVSFFNEKKEEN